MITIINVLPLTADIEHLEVEALEGELRLDDSRRLHASPQHVLLGGNVVRRRDPANEKMARKFKFWKTKKMAG